MSNGNMIEYACSCLHAETMQTETGVDIDILHRVIIVETNSTTRAKDIAVDIYLSLHPFLEPDDISCKCDSIEDIKKNKWVLDDDETDDESEPAVWRDA